MAASAFKECRIDHLKVHWFDDWNTSQQIEVSVTLQRFMKAFVAERRTYDDESTVGQAAMIFYVKNYGSVGLPSVPGETAMTVTSWLVQLGVELMLTAQALTVTHSTNGRRCIGDEESEGGPVEFVEDGKVCARNAETQHKGVSIPVTGASEDDAQPGRPVVPATHRKVIDLTFSDDDERPGTPRRSPVTRQPLLRERFESITPDSEDKKPLMRPNGGESTGSVTNDTANDLVRSRIKEKIDSDDGQHPVRDRTDLWPQQSVPIEEAFAIARTVHYKRLLHVPILSKTSDGSIRWIQHFHDPALASIGAYNVGSALWREKRRNLVYRPDDDLFMVNDFIEYLTVSGVEDDTVATLRQYLDGRSAKEVRVGRLYAR